MTQVELDLDYDLSGSRPKRATFPEGVEPTQDDVVALFFVLTSVEEAAA